MGKSKGKPTMQVRKPPTDRPDADKVAAFIGGENAGERGSSDVQKSGSPECQTSEKERRQTTIYFDRDVFQQLKVHCALEGAEMSSTVTEAVRKYINDCDGSKTH